MRCDVMTTFHIFYKEFFFYYLFYIIEPAIINLKEFYVNKKKNSMRAQTNLHL